MRASEDQLKGWMISGLDGDAEAHASLLKALVPMLQGFYRRRMEDARDDIEDLVQETLMAIHTRRASYDVRRPFCAWLFAIARYKMIDHFRQVRRYRHVEDLDEILAAEGFEEVSGARMDVDSLLNSLPPKQAKAIRSTRLEGFSVAETAAAANIGESDVKISVHRGLKALSSRIRGGK